MPKRRQRSFLRPQALGLSKLPPEQLWDEFNKALARYVCTHHQPPCQDCIDFIHDLGKPALRGWLQAALHYTAKRREGYQALGCAVEQFIETSKRFVKGAQLQILSNKAQCLKCGDEIETPEGERRVCSCRTIWIAQKNGTLVRGGDLRYFKDLSVTRED